MIGTSDKYWPVNAGSLAKVEAKWSNAKGSYTFPDGNVLLDPDAGPFKQFIWRVPFDGEERIVIARRVDSRDVDFTITGFDNGRTKESGAFRLVSLTSGEPILAQIKMPDPKFEGGAYGTGAELATGSRVC
jgi:hypothetical protein